MKPAYAHTYNRRYYENRKKRMIAKAQRHHALARAVITKAKDVPCMDCGVRYLIRDGP